MLNLTRLRCFTGASAWVMAEAGMTNLMHCSASIDSARMISVWIICSMVCFASCHIAAFPDLSRLQAAAPPSASRHLHHQQHVPGMYQIVQRFAESVMSGFTTPADWHSKGGLQPQLAYSGSYLLLQTPLV